MGQVMSISAAHKVVVDAWQLYMDYAGRLHTDDDWQKIIQRMKNLHAKHELSPFAKDVIVAVVHELERQDKHFLAVKNC